MSSLSTYPHRSFRPMFYQENPKYQEIINSLMPEKENLTLSLFPNPVKGACTIQLMDATNTKRVLNGEIVVHDFIGNVVHKDSVKDIFEWTITLDKWLAGVYFCSYRDSNHKVFTQKILLLP